MARPNKDRIVAFNPDVGYFKPRGIPLREMQEVHLTLDECEAVRLADLLNMSHESAGSEMGVSRATFGRILQQARKSIADALINGKAIRIIGGNYRYDGNGRRYCCGDCLFQWVVPLGKESPRFCPECDGGAVSRL
ncbi:MAG: DUF134 domain-containing protein [Desulfobacterales bacterium]